MSHWVMAISQAYGHYILSRFRLSPVEIRRVTKCELCRHVQVGEDALRCTGPQARGEACVPQAPERGCSDYEHGPGAGEPGWYLVTTEGRELLVPPEHRACVVSGVAMARGLEDPDIDEWAWIE
jgi:hypothetical protein